MPRWIDADRNIELSLTNPLSTQYVGVRNSLSYKMMKIRLVLLLFNLPLSMTGIQETISLMLPTGCSFKGKQNRNKGVFKRCMLLWVPTLVNPEVLSGKSSALDNGHIYRCQAVIYFWEIVQHCTEYQLFSALLCPTKGSQSEYHLLQEWPISHSTFALLCLLYLYVELDDHLISHSTLLSPNFWPVACRERVRAPFKWYTSSNGLVF